MGKILALDLATSTGYAIGDGATGMVLRSGARILKDDGADQGFAFANLIAWLNTMLSQEEPALVVYEAPLPLGGHKKKRNSEASVMNSYGMRAITIGMCRRFGVRTEKVYPATVRKHFLDKANFGDRDATKAAVIKRCQLLRYIPMDCTNADRADACAILDWALNTLCRKTPKVLHLFGEAA